MQVHHTEFHFIAIATVGYNVIDFVINNKLTLVI